MKVSRREIFNHVLAEHRMGRLRTRVTDIECECPACHRDRKFSVNVYSGRYACFTCDLSGSILSEILQNKPRWVPVRALLGGGSVTGGTGRTGTGPEARGAVSLPLWPIAGYPDHPLPPPPGPRPLAGQLRRGYEYCLLRGMTPGQIGAYRVGMKGFDSRVYFPYWTGEGEMTYWMGRTILPEEQPKTLEPGTEKPLYGVHVHEPTPDGVVSLVEGVFDHFATRGSLAAMGSFVSEAQALALQRLRPLWVPILFDPDAVQRAIRACELLWSVGVPSAVVKLVGTEKDPADLGFEIMGGVMDALEAMNPPKRLQIYKVAVSTPSALPGEDAAWRRAEIGHRSG